MKRFSAIVLALAPVAALACCGVGMGGVPVRFAGQSDLVISDPATRTEHFVRDASFATKGDRLGFLAPTPTPPKLEEAAPDLFDRLEAIHARYETRDRRSPVGCGMAAEGAAGGVLERKLVAGYDAAVLRAKDAGDLAAWLKANDFPAEPWTERWAAPYLKRGWTITAFKVAGGEDVKTGVVRMSFRTEKPFAPYSVPRENGGANSLRLFLITPDSLRGTVGGRAWEATGGEGAQDRTRRRH